jgi:hypothetical protein
MMLEALSANAEKVFTKLLMFMVLVFRQCCRPEGQARLFHWLGLAVMLPLSGGWIMCVEETS